MSFLSENEIEDWACEILRECGYTVTTGPEISPGGAHPERASLSDVILTGRLRAAIDRLNPHLSQAARDEALLALRREDTPDVVDENRRLHFYLVDGVPVDVVREDGTQLATGRDCWILTIPSATTSSPCVSSCSRKTRQTGGPISCCSSTACLWA